MKCLGRWQVFFILWVLLFSAGSLAWAQQRANDPDRLERFSDLGLGLFIHWSMDSQIGSVISHSMVGASDEYLKRYIDELPRTFDPPRLEPEEWARLAAVTLQSVRLVDEGRVEVLGQNGKVLEYQPDVEPKASWRQTSEGIEIRAMRAHSYNDRSWPNPVVLKLTGARYRSGP